MEEEKDRLRNAALKNLQYIRQRAGIDGENGRTPIESGVVDVHWVSPAVNVPGNRCVLPFHA